jgi:2-polyprenyl-6-methoxyphenol hydroxylase-like FAD-dependent oxidoreductase
MQTCVVVLGDGMAGMACARALAKLGRAPLLIAPDCDVPNRSETLSARAHSLLDDLGWPHLLGKDTPFRVDNRYSVWGGSALARSFEPPGQPSGWQIDRGGFEGSMLAALMADDVERVSGKVRRVSQARDSVDLELEDGRTIRAKFVVDCTGRASITSGAASCRRRLDRLTACYSLLNLPSDAEPARATLVEAVTSGWWYSSVLPDRRMFVAFFSDSDLMPSGTRKDPQSGPSWRERRTRRPRVSLASAWRSTIRHGALHRRVRSFRRAWSTIVSSGPATPLPRSTHWRRTVSRPPYGAASRPRGAWTGSSAETHRQPPGTSASFFKVFCLTSRPRG